MYSFFLIIHLVICILLVIIVLFQAGKKFGLSGLMGGGSSDAIVTGSGGNSLIKKITTVLAFLFLCTSLCLTILTSKKSNESLMSNILPPAPNVSNVGTSSNTLAK